MTMLLGAAQVMAQNSGWKSEFDNKANFLLYKTKDDRFVVGTTLRDICVLDAATGKTVWSSTFKDIADVKTCENQYVMEEAGVIFLMDKRLGKDNIFCVDIADGKLLWKSSEYQGVNIHSTVYFPDLNSFAIVEKKGLVTLDAKTGETKWEQERFKGALAHWEYLKESNELVMLNYKANWAALFTGFKNQLMKVNASTGELVWETEYKGVVPTKYIGQMPISKMNVTDNRIYCVIEGIQVFDLTTGEKVWTAGYNSYDVKIKLGGETYVYGGIPAPLVVGDDVYIVRMEHASPKVFIEKRNVHDGAIIWTHRMDSKPDVIPYIGVADGKLVMQLGGNVEVHKKTKNGTERLYEWMPPFRLEVYDASTGELAWKTKKLNKRLTNPIIKDGTIFAGDQSSFYGFDLTTGEVKVTKRLGTIKTGGAKELYSVGDNIGIVGQNGFAMLNDKYAPTYFIKLKEPNGKCLIRGDHVLLENKKEVRVISILTGAEKLAHKTDKNFKFSFAPDGSYILLMSPKSVNRFPLL